MAKRILVMPEELRNNARQIRNLKVNHIGIMGRLTNLVFGLASVWSGLAQIAFVQKYTSMQPIYNSFQKAIEEFAVLMEKHADRMEKVDNNMAQNINRI